MDCCWSSLRTLGWRVLQPYAWLALLWAIEPINAALWSTTQRSCLCHLWSNTVLKRQTIKCPLDLPRSINIKKNAEAIPIDFCFSFPEMLKSWLEGIRYMRTTVKRDLILQRWKHSYLIVIHLPAYRPRPSGSRTNPHHLSKCQFCVLTSGLDIRLKSHITTQLPSDYVNADAEKNDFFEWKSSWT